MNRASLLIPFLLVGTGSLFLACASGDTGFGGAGGESINGPSVAQSTANVTAAVTNASATVTASVTTGGEGCIGSCGINADCANTCPAVQADQANCCDTGTHICYVAESAMCPLPATTTGATSTGAY